MRHKIIGVVCQHGHVNSEKDGVWSCENSKGYISTQHGLVQGSIFSKPLTVKCMIMLLGTGSNVVS